ncbi:CpsD/CapB family tyrosine-protein kinase [Bacillus pacificus]|uniref:CpsD/CapB family tyrosine-protein kinase n=1 Tax=Bacillus pacificus TaxID=2026187 RepID=UPI003D2113D8
MFFTNRWKTAKIQRESLITHCAPGSKISEQFRMIRTNFQSTAIDWNKKIFLITSPKCKEGTTTITTNLAISLAQQGERVLVIDANLRKPKLHMIFDFENRIGLTNILNRESTLEEVVIPTEIDGLYALTSGVTSFNPAELLNSAMMEGVLRKVINEYDFVLLDSSPVLEVTDTRILANLCDGIVLVLSVNRTTSAEVLKVKKILSSARGKVEGIILNRTV